MSGRTSLSKRVFGTVFTLSIALILIFTVAGTIFVQHRLASTTRTELANEAGVVAASLNSVPSYTALLRRLDLDDTRATLIAADGTVLFDSQESSASMPNHITRPEVAQALRTGRGASERASTTIGEVMLYEAVRLADGTVIRLAQSQTGYLGILGSFLVPLALLALAGAAISAFIARRESARIIEPLLQVDLDHPAQSTANAYSEMIPMLDRIEKQRKELKRQMRVLADNDRMRREFTANITHELKTPLTAISGYAELIATGMVESEDDKRDFARRILGESGRLTSLVNDILTLSNLDEVEHSLSPDRAEVLGAREPIDLPRLLDSVAQRLEGVAAKADVALLVEADPAIVTGVPRLLDEMVYNLASNAIRYNRTGGSVTLSCGLRAGDASVASAAEGPDAGSDGDRPDSSALAAASVSPRPYICVADTGIGIAPEEQEKIFERFYRVDKSRSKARGGTGLGLAIVKHAALFHDASLDLKSEPGAGTQITVVFPEGFSM